MLAELKEAVEKACYQKGQLLLAMGWLMYWQTLVTLHPELGYKKEAQK